MHDLVIMVASMNAPPSHNRLYDRLELAKKDPVGAHVIPAVTSFDAFRANCGKSTGEVDKMLMEWKNYYKGQLPYFLSLHKLEKDPNLYGSDSKSQFLAKNAAIKKQLDMKESDSVTWVQQAAPAMNNEYVRKILSIVM